MKKIRTLCIGIALLLSGCTTSSPVIHSITLRSSNGVTQSLQVELADTPADQERGLMGRTELAEDHGMLFRFSSDQSLAFWMKNTLIPLDIIFFTQDGSFVSTTTMPLCTTDPCTVFRSAKPASYGLEVPAGYAHTHAISSGSSIILDGLPPAAQ